MNPIGSAIIAIAPCGPALCGKVVWASARGQREVAKNTRRVVGMTVLTNVRPGPNAWTGNLYIPDDNINVSARLTPLNGRRMRLTGCALLGCYAARKCGPATKARCPAAADPVHPRAS